MGDLIHLHTSNEETDNSLILCQVCAVKDILSLTFYVYEDNSFKCTNCGTFYEFNPENDSA